MRPLEVKEYQWPSFGEGIRHQNNGELKYAPDMKGICAECPLACHPHPLVEDTENKNSFHKLCTLSVIASDDVKLLAVLEAFGKKKEKKLKLIQCPDQQLSIFDLSEQTLPEVSANQKLIDLYRCGGLFPDEAKILVAGFTLLRYIREDKSISSITPEIPPRRDIWSQVVSAQFATYSQAERNLAASLKDPQTVQVSPTTGEIVNGGDRNKLILAGFDFYRTEGIIQGHGTPRIKCASKGWGTWQKYETAGEVKAAWEELMKDEKVLNG
jgi:hypothetical protein